MLQGFTMLTEDLDHPEGVAWGLDGYVYAGGEAGQIYRISLEGEVDEIASTGGEILGVAIDGRGRVYACDPGNEAVMRVTPDTGIVEEYSRGTAADPMRLPNMLAFDESGYLYVTDSGEYLDDDGVVYRVTPDGEAVVWSREPSRYPNGCCLDADGSLVVAESYRPGVVRVPVQADGSAGPMESIVDLPNTVPDGVALDATGRLVVTCYRPDRLYIVPPGGSPEVFADDPHGAVLNAPTNVAFVGKDLGRMVVANVGEWHLAITDIGTTGLPLSYPTWG
jgi:gluconolactonase